MRPKHPSSGNEVSDGSFGTPLLVSPEGNGITVPLGAVNGAFRWYQDESGDELTDEILAWAATEEARQASPREPADQGPPAERLPA
jgi:hypothetical protein